MDIKKVASNNLKVTEDQNDFQNPVKILNKEAVKKITDACNAINSEKNPNCWVNNDFCGYDSCQ